jgi:hypothetical protein
MAHLSPRKMAPFRDNMLSPGVEHWDRYIRATGCGTLSLTSGMDGELSGVDSYRH